MPRSLAYQFPPRGQYYSATDGAQSGLEAGIIMVVNDCEFSALANDLDTEGRLLGITIPAGSVLPGETTGFTLVSGVVLHGLA